MKNANIDPDRISVALWNMPLDELRKLAIAEFQKSPRAKRAPAPKPKKKEVQP